MSGLKLRKTLHSREGEVVEWDGIWTQTVTCSKCKTKLVRKDCGDDPLLPEGWLKIVQPTRTSFYTKGFLCPGCLKEIMR